MPVLKPEYKLTDDDKIESNKMLNSSPKLEKESLAAERKIL